MKNYIVDIKTSSKTVRFKNEKESFQAGAEELGYALSAALYIDVMKQGKIQPDLHIEKYHGDRTHLSSSALKLLLKDEVEFAKKYVLNQSEANPPGLQAAFDFGTYIHAKLLEPETISEDFTFNPKNKDEKGKIYIDHKQLILASELEMAYESHPIASKIISGGKAEQTFFGKLDGVNIKVRADYLVGNPKKITDFVFVVLHKKKKYCTIVKASESFLEKGRAQYKKAIAKYKRLSKEGFFDRTSFDDYIPEID